MKVATGGLHSHIDYESFVGVGTIGLVVPLSCIFAGLSVLVDRHSGAQRELLAAPVPRAFLVLGNLVVALALAMLQVVVLIGLSALRGGSFHVTLAGVGWFEAKSGAGRCMKLRTSARRFAAPIVRASDSTSEYIVWM